MLGLSTHEPYFYIIRETIVTPQDKNCTICGQNGHFFTECDKQDRDEDKRVSRSVRNILVNFQFIKLYVMRQYLEYEFKSLENDGFQCNLERIIDDFVFMCFFVGNDFLPHIPTLSIREGGIDTLLFLYKRLLPVA